ncbi:MAG: hypothetical protein HY725_14060 [Candidatus Rokubacteria bacterium]|nr:hypothetical protein [Candidatus Rokubacteria bacterium]
MARDDFTKQTQDILAKRVGVRCSNPSCRKLTTGPRTESHHIVNIGVGAHITAASPGGPRYGPSLTPQQRQSPENGIWLCQNCAKLVDNDRLRYPAELLRGWKAQAEASTLAALEGRGEPHPIDLSAELDLSYAEGQIRSDRHDYRLEVTLTNRGTEPLGPYHIDLEIPSRVVASPEEQQSYVPDRSTREVAFFRVAASTTEQEIYPGDTRLVMSVPYYIDQRLFWNRGDLFEQPVGVTLYRRGFGPFTLERLFGDFQIF